MTFELDPTESIQISMMATGDLKNNLMKLLRETRRMKIESEPDIQGLSVGSASSFLALLHAAVMHYSLPLANWFTHHGYDLYGRSDLRFLQELYRVLRDVFHYHPKLTKEQFLSVGFAERKVLMTRDILLFCQAKHAELTAHNTSNTHSAKRKWRLSASSKASGNHSNATAVKRPDADVLTVQERAGIDPVSAEHNYKVDEPSSPPPNMTPPPLLRWFPTGGSELNVSPLPPPRPQPQRITSSPIQLSPSPPLQNSTPPLLSSSPPLVRSSPEKQGTSPETVSITARVIRHNSPSAKSEHVPPLVMTDTEPSLEKEENNSTCSESWGSMPPQREGREKEIGDQQDLHEAVGSRVEQLTKMVENLAAKFMLLENHLKLQVEGRGSMETTDSDGPANTGEKEKERRETLALRDITREVLSKQPHAASPAKQSQSNSPLKQAQSSSLPIQTFSSKEVSRSEVAVSRREATPPSSVSAPEPSSERTPLPSLRENHIHRYSSHSICHYLDPSTPEDTQRLIQSLRARAEETKEFLQLANSRLVDLS